MVRLLRMKQECIGPVPIEKTIAGVCNTRRTNYGDGGGLNGIPADKTLLFNPVGRGTKILYKRRVL